MSWTCPVSRLLQHAHRLASTSGCVAAVLDPLSSELSGLTPRLASRMYSALPSPDPECSSSASSFGEHSTGSAPSAHELRAIARDRLKSMEGTRKTPASFAEPQPSQPSEPKPTSWREVLSRVQTAAEPRSSILTDSFARVHTYLRISLTERCNLRCQYCMPADGIDLTPSEQLLTTDEIQRLASIFVEAGVNKIRLTGGEPTVRRDLVKITQKLGDLPGLTSLAMTTNGIVLGRQLPALRAAGMKTLNISLDTLHADRFEEMTRRRGHERVLASIHDAVALGFQVKVNVVLMRGVNDDELVPFVELARTLPINVRFIEYMPFDDNAWTKQKMYTYKEMMSVIQEEFGPMHRCADPVGEVAKNYYLDGFAGTVSFITSMTEHFCSDCNRVRLMADGNLKVCLFGASEVSLRDAMREGASDDELRTIIGAAITRKRAKHADMDILAQTQNRPMIKIGG